MLIYENIQTNLFSPFSLDVFKVFGFGMMYEHFKPPSSHRFCF